MSETSGTFGGWSDRLTYVVAEAQLLVAGVLMSIAVALIWFRPELPGIPPIVHGWIAAIFLLGPPLTGMFITGARKLRNRNMVTVHHINGVEDVREKYYVEPGVWDDKEIVGPSPYTVNNGGAFEVREFDWHPDQGDDGTLIVTGCYMSEMADSKLVTTKAMLEDVHGDLIDVYLAYNRLRGRISKMGLEIQRDVVNQEAEADERGLMNPKTTVKDRFESAEKDAEEKATEDIQDVDGYEGEYIGEHGEHAPPARPRPNQLYDTVDGVDPMEMATTDGGQNDG
ncbi:hypothetical protein SAMN05444422_11344 [Halobiforma haloterrestris]|uniref:Uncharacterized protein n=1 Tax=Natronobacterium haloterrestre TaxID=148448 RepID=A0A1I1KWV0_NATHA|nr:hypothetical protein [Halobiforma haloterrestris]SFC65296.1 hypothetical protein SAMN05444422_11344 [Halobiforma haloterrestris]